MESNERDLIVKELRGVVKELRELTLWLAPMLVYFGLVTLFIPDDPENLITLVVVGVPMYLFLATLVLLPAVLIYLLARKTVFANAASWRRALVFVCSVIVPLTAETYVFMPQTSRTLADIYPVFTSVWVFLAFAGASLLALALVSGMAPSVKASPAPPGQTVHGDTNAAGSPSRRPPFAAIVALLAGIASIIGVSWSILRDILER